MDLVHDFPPSAPLGTVGEGAEQLMAGVSCFERRQLYLPALFLLFLLMTRLVLVPIQYTFEKLLPSIDIPPSDCPVPVSGCPIPQAIDLSRTVPEYVYACVCVDSLST